MRVMPKVLPPSDSILQACPFRSGGLRSENVIVSLRRETNPCPSLDIGVKLRIVFKHLKPNATIAFRKP